MTTPVLPNLAAQSDLEAAMQRPLDAAQAGMALRRASARVRGYCRQLFTFVAQETIVLGGGDQVLRLPQGPLVVDGGNPLSVIELVDFLGTEFVLVEERDFTRLGSELRRGYPWYAPTRLRGWPYTRALGVWAPRVQVTYSHGYRSVPDDVLDIVLDLAATNLSNPLGLRTERVGGEEVVYASETIGHAKLTDDHQQSLRPYRMGSFSIRTVM